MFGRPPGGCESDQTAERKVTLVDAGSGRRGLRTWFDRDNDPYRQLRDGFVALGFVLLTGTAGYVWLCGWSLAEAVYMLIITISSVGFGEIGPRTRWDRWVTSYVVIFGITAAAYLFSGLIQLMSLRTFRQVVNRQMQTRKLENLKDHHIICGFGRMGAMICQDLHLRRQPFVLVEREPERIAYADREGYLFVEGDATDESVLSEAGIDRARSLVCVLPSDADNVFVTLTGRNMNKSVFIAARAERLSTEKKLKQAGADRVVAPHVIGAQRISGILARPTTVEILELVSGRRSVDLEMNEASVGPGSAFIGQSLAEAEIRKKTGVVIVAIKRKDGRLVVNPESDVRIEASDTIVILGRAENVEAFRAMLVG